MERDMSQNTALCRSGCGFYGSSATDGFCSKCYKDAVKRKQTAQQATPATTATSSHLQSSDTSSLSLLPPPASTMIMPAQFCASSVEVKKSENVNKKSNNEISTEELCKSDATTTTTSDTGVVANAVDDNKEQPQKRKKTRCTKCKISVGVIGFPCRCGGVFCVTHRYANEHSCSFDYKEHGAEEIRKNNPQVVGEKIQKI